MKDVIKRGGKPPLVIVGTAGSCGEAPYDDEIDGKPVYEMWGCGTTSAKKEVKRLDRLFELHPKRYWGQIPVLERMNSFTGEIYMQDHYDEIPKSAKFPYQEVRDMFYHSSMGDNLYVTNTITWMVLLALYEGYKDISFFGVHMAHETEYAYQRSSLSWVLGIIQARIMDGQDYKLYIHPDSSLLKAEYEYGFGEPTRQMQYVQSLMNNYKQGVQQGREEIKEKQVRIYRTEGAIEGLQHVYEKLAGFK